MDFGILCSESPHRLTPHVASVCVRYVVSRAYVCLIRLTIPTFFRATLIAEYQYARRRTVTPGQSDYAARLACALEHELERVLLGVEIEMLGDDTQ